MAGLPKGRRMTGRLVTTRLEDVGASCGGKPGTWTRNLTSDPKRSRCAEVAAMAAPYGLDIDESAEPPRLRPGRLWAGGVATAVVAALVLVAGGFLRCGTLGLPVL